LKIWGEVGNAYFVRGISWRIIIVLFCSISYKINAIHFIANIKKDETQNIYLLGKKNKGANLIAPRYQLTPQAMKDRRGIFNRLLACHRHTMIYVYPPSGTTKLNPWKNKKHQLMQIKIIFIKLILVFFSSTRTLLPRSLVAFSRSCLVLKEQAHTDILWSYQNHALSLGR